MPHGRSLVTAFVIIDIRFNFMIIGTCDMLFFIILAGVQCLVKCFKTCISLSALSMESILNHVHGYNDDILELVVKAFFVLSKHLY